MDEKTRANWHQITLDEMIQDCEKEMNEKNNSPKEEDRT